MNLLLSMVRNIALLVLVCSFWELLAPRGGLRGPVRLVVGLLLVACVVLPITDALARAPNPWELDYPAAAAGDTDALDEGRAIATQMEQTARSQYEADVARQVSSLCLLSDGVRTAKAAVKAEVEGGALTHIIIEAELAADADAAAVASKLSSLISTFFAIEEQYVECRVTKEVTEDGGEQGAPAADNG